MKISDIWYFIIGFVISFVVCAIVIEVTKYFIKRKRQKKWEEMLSKVIKNADWEDDSDTI